MRPYVVRIHLDKHISKHVCLIGGQSHIHMTSESFVKIRLSTKPE